MVLTRKTFIFLNLVLLGALVYHGVAIFYKVTAAQLEHAPVSTKTRPDEETRADAVKRPFNYYATIKTRDLFKTETKAVNQALVDVSALEVTGLELKLWGTVADENSQRTYAVIEDLKTRQQGLYRPGDPIQNATVRIVLREKVILNVSGRDEVLEMTGPVAAEAAPRGQQRKPAGGRKIALRRTFVAEAMQDIGSLMSQAKIRPHLENGQPAGLMLTSIKPGSMFRRLGLRNGDVLTAVAGRPVTTIDEAAALYTELKSADSVTVQIKRRNRLQMLTYEIQ